MRLLRIEIENFGKLSKFSLDLKNGLNVLHEKNGWGKSTLAVFLKAMLYGLPASTVKDLDKNERKKYIPWQGGSYGGSIEFESEKGRFRAERFFGAKEAEDEFSLFDLSTNQPSNAYSAELGAELFGIDADGFERSAYLSQRDMKPKGDNPTVAAKLTGLLEDVNDIGSFDTAMELLDERRKFYELKGGRGRIADLTAELSDRRAELEECRAKRAIQREQENRLTQYREQIEQTDRELAGVREQLRKADAVQAQRGECDRMRQRILEQEARRREILRSFRGEQIPTDREFAAAHAELNSFRDLQTAQRSLCLTPEERSELEHLQKCYPNGVPDREKTEQLRQSMEALSKAKAESAAAKEIPDSPEQVRFRKCGIPPQALTAEAKAKLDRAEQLEREIKQAENTPPPPSLRRIPLVLPVALFLAGLAAAGIGLALTAYRIPLLTAGGILAVIGLLTLLFGGPRNNAAEREAEARRLDSMRTDRSNAIAFVQGVLKQYGVFPANGDIRSALSELQLLARRAKEDEQRQSKQREQIALLDRRVASARQDLNESLRLIGNPGLPADPQAALLQIRTDMQDRSRLLDKKRKTEESYARAQAGLQEHQAKLSDFLNRLTERESRQPEECLAKMERLADEQARLFGEIDAQKKELQKLIGQNRLNETAALPSPEQLENQCAVLERRLDALRREQADEQHRSERTAEQTQKIPGLEDQVDNLDAELKVAKDNLNILRKTAELLTQSKEALSTRYLDGMQRNFTAYRSVLEEAGAPEANITASLDVTVRDGGKSRAIDCYSKGSRDLLQFCARLALSKEMFSEGETPFLLLDDPFVNLDEAHFSAVRKLLDRLASELQILYLVCHRDRM